MSRKKAFLGHSAHFILLSLRCCLLTPSGGMGILCESLPCCAERKSIFVVICPGFKGECGGNLVFTIIILHNLHILFAEIGWCDRRGVSGWLICRPRCRGRGAGCLLDKKEYADGRDSVCFSSSSSFSHGDIGKVVIEAVVRLRRCGKCIMMVRVKMVVFMVMALHGKQGASVRSPRS